jgi:hypothetical protein
MLNNIGVLCMTELDVELPPSWDPLHSDSSLSPPLELSLP